MSLSQQQGVLSCRHVFHSIPAAVFRKVTIQELKNGEAYGKIYVNYAKRAIYRKVHLSVKTPSLQ